MEKLLCNYQLRKDHAEAIQRAPTPDMDARSLQEFRKYSVLFRRIMFLFKLGGAETCSPRDAPNVAIEYSQVNQEPGSLLWPQMEAM